MPERESESALRAEMQTLLQRVAELERLESARREVEATRRQRNVYLRRLFEQSPLAIVLLNIDDRVIESNLGFERLFGYSPEETRNRDINSLIVGDDEKADAEILTGRATSGEVVDVERVRRHKDGSPIEVRILAHPIRENERQIGIYALYSDVGRQQRDPLTELPNRSLFLERVEVELERAARKEFLAAVMVLDVDRFKDVNHAFGLVAGDALLKSLSERLLSVLPEGATLARLGGDSFAVLQGELEDVGSAAALARQLQAALDRPFEVQGHPVRVSASIGIAVCSAGGSRPGNLLGQAERAVAQVKREGGRGFRFHDQDMDQPVRERMLLGQRLHGAVERQEFFLELQPQIDLKSREIVGAEALVRWHNPKEGLVAPSRFIPIAEASGAIVEIGAWVLEAACTQAQAWRLQEGFEITVAVNLSPVQFRDLTLPDRVGEILRTTGLAPRLLELEVTERLLMEGSPDLVGILLRLHQMGVRFSLDDFGKGYASLEYLRRLPIDKLKIDRSFVARAELDPNDIAIINAVALLGERLGLRVLAEGVERAAQVELLEAQGCHQIQGYYFSPPVSASQFSRLLREGSDTIRPWSGGQRPLPAGGESPSELAQELNAPER